jgi:hypothetical protein
MGMRQQIAYRHDATKSVQNTADDHKRTWYVSKQTIHVDLHVPFTKDVIQEKSIKHHDKLGNHSNAPTDRATKKEVEENLASRPN